MTATSHSSLARTAAELMTRDVLLIHQDTLMRDAARLLYEAQVSGAPVVDDYGTCVGVLSASDFVRMAGQPQLFPSPGPEIPLTCGFQRRLQRTGGDETTLWHLAADDVHAAAQGTSCRKRRVDYLQRTTLCTHRLGRS